MLHAAVEVCIQMINADIKIFISADTDADTDIAIIIGSFLNIL